MRTLTSMSLATPAQLGGRLLMHSVMLSFPIRLPQWRALMFKVERDTSTIIIFIGGPRNEGDILSLNYPTLHLYLVCMSKSKNGQILFNGFQTTSLIPRPLLILHIKNWTILYKHEYMSTIHAVCGCIYMHVHQKI